jgi:ankyrin repeat protein
MIKKEKKMIKKVNEKDESLFNLSLVPQACEKAVFAYKKKFGDTSQSYKDVLTWLKSLNKKDYNNFLSWVLGAHKNIDVIIKFLNEKADVNIQDEDDGWTPLHYASINGDEKIVSILIKNGAKINIQDDGWTPLHNASINGDEKIVSILIKKGAKINIQDDGWTPLHNASINGDEKMVSILIKKGAKINIQNKNGLTPLHYASKNGHEKMVSIMKNGVDFNNK